MPHHPSMLPQFKRDADGGLTDCPERIPRQGQGSQLAACAKRAIFHDHAPLLAESRSV